MGYLTYDFLLILSHPNMCEPSIMVHHVLFVFTSWLNLSNSFMKWAAIVLLFCEASTPLVNLRWFLIVKKQKDGYCYKLINVLLLLVFFITRVAMNGVCLFGITQNMNLVLAVPMVLKIVTGNELLIRNITIGLGGFSPCLYYTYFIPNMVHRHT